MPIWTLEGSKAAQSFQFRNQLIFGASLPLRETPGSSLSVRDECQQICADSELNLVKVQVSPCRVEIKVSPLEVKCGED